jgi:hypothetical protein
MKREFMRTTIMDDDGKIKKAFVPKDMVSEQHHVWRPEDWTPEMEKHKKDRVKWLEETIAKVDDRLENAELSDYETVMLLFFKDQLKVDLREDKQRIKYKGMIPKHIDDRCIRQASKSFSKYRRWGDNLYEQLREDIDVKLWGNVIVDGDPSQGSGKLE